MWLVAPTRDSPPNVSVISIATVQVPLLWCDLRWHSKCHTLQGCDLYWHGDQLGLPMTV